MPCMCGCVLFATVLTLCSASCPSLWYRLRPRRRLCCVWNASTASTGCKRQSSAASTLSSVVTRSARCVATVFASLAGDVQYTSARAACRLSLTLTHLFLSFSLLSSTGCRCLLSSLSAVSCLCPCALLSAAALCSGWPGVRLVLWVGRDDIASAAAAVAAIVA